MSPPSSLLHSLLSLDASISLSLHSFFQFLPRRLLKTLEISGDGRLILPLLTSLLVLLSPSLSLSLLIGSVLDLALIGLLKHLIRRSRPVYNKPDMTVVVALDKWSFPSGHSSRVFFIFVFFWLEIEGLREVWVNGFGAGLDAGLDPVEGIVKGVGVWALATSASRVLLGRHYVADVAVGAGLGVLEGWITYRFCRV